MSGIFCQIWRWVIFPKFKKIKNINFLFKIARFGIFRQKWRSMTSFFYSGFFARNDAGWYSQNSKKLRISIFIQNCAFWNFLPEMTLHDFLFLAWIFLPEMTLGNIPGFYLVLGMNHFHHVLFLFGDVTWPGSSYI